MGNKRVKVFGKTLKTLQNKQYKYKIKIKHE